MIKSKIYAYSGTHGTGKTTAAYKKVYEMKLQHRTERIAPVTEVARNCPFPINKKADKATQIRIFATQIQQEVEAAKQNDIVVCDRSIFDCIGYTKVLGLKCWEEMFKLAKVYAKYECIYFCANEWCYDDGAKSGDLEWRREVHMAIKSLLDRSGQKVVEI